MTFVMRRPDPAPAQRRIQRDPTVLDPHFRPHVKAEAAEAADVNQAGRDPSGAYDGMAWLYAGVDAAELTFRRAGCFDVGVRCGGWGNVVLEFSMRDREKAS